MKAYAIADLPHGADREALLDRVELLSSLGVDVIQLRARHLDDRELLNLAVRCRQRISADVVYLINRRADIAIAAGADGVHLPSDGVPPSLVRMVDPELIVGVSCHSGPEVAAAREAGADLAVIGPLFPARSSEKPSEISIAALTAMEKQGIELYALGGFTIDRLPLLADTGVAGVAAITMFLADEPVERILAAVREVAP